MMLKQPKFFFYLKNLILISLPKRSFQSRKKRMLASIKNTDKEAIKNRVNYYNKLPEGRCPQAKDTTIASFKWGKPSAYFMDLKPLLKYFNKTQSLNYLFGDVIKIPPSPTIVKSRPIEGDNENAIIMKLNKRRHFIFVKDKLSFQEKESKLIWRGNILENQKSRQIFLKNHASNPLCNLGHLNDFADNRHKVSKTPIREHLKHKYILSIEGNDVATNLKWIMSSNSLCFMCKPKYETWFMEGKLVPNHHYVLLRDDFSDLNEKIEYYNAHHDKALAIIKNANDYTMPFRNEKHEWLTSLLVLEKYFNLTNEL